MYASRQILLFYIYINEVKPIFEPLNYFKMKFFSLISLSLILLISCKKDNSKIYSNFYIRYDDTDENVKAEAVFFVGDTIDNAKPFVPENGVFFDEGAMEQKDLVNRIVFKSERSTDVKPYFEFKYKNKNKTYDKFELPLPYLSSFHINNNSISLDSGFVVKWEGKPLAKNENMVIFITDSKNLDKNILFEGPTENSSINVLSNKLIGLSIGDGSIYLVRKSNNNEIIENLRRSSQAEFYSKASDIHILN